jgi:hypothetical protein
MGLFMYPEQPEMSIIKPVTPVRIPTMLPAW